MKAPFTAKPVEIARTRQRFSGFAWSPRPHVAFRYEYDENRHWTTTRIVDVDKPGDEGRLLWDMSSDELYKDPGSFVYTRLPSGAVVARMEGALTSTDCASSVPLITRPQALIARPCAVTNGSGEEQ